MRLAGVLLAVLMIAACPPRRARVVYVQQCVPCQPCAPVIVQSVPVAPVVVAPAPEVKTDPVLAAHLTAWEKRVTATTSFRSEVTVKRVDAVFKRETNFAGVVLCLKPNYAVMRLDNTNDPTKIDYEAYICDGKSVFAYSGIEKTVTEFALPQNALPDDLLFGLFLGMKASAVQERLDITLFKTDEHYIYFDIKPRLAKDRRAFKHLRLALYNTGANTAAFAYLPAQAYLHKADDSTEIWKFTNPQVDVKGIAPSNFQYVEVKEKGWKVQKAPPAPVKP